jgi:hypothetical protein
MPKAEVSAMPPALAPSEIVLVDRYATEGEALHLRVIDLDSRRVRRVPVLRTAKNHTYVQFTQLAAHVDQLSFAGQYSGKASPLRARVEEIDGCEAQRGVECFGTPDTVVLSPTAGVIGTVAFPRATAP